jgi:hypothetical protein
VLERSCITAVLCLQFTSLPRSCLAGWTENDPVLLAAALVADGRAEVQPPGVCPQEVVVPSLAASGAFAEVVGTAAAVCTAAFSQALCLWEPAIAACPSCCGAFAVH